MPSFFCLTYIFAKLSYTVSVHKSGYRGGDWGTVPPLSNFRGGLSPPEDCPPPEQFRGGGQPKCPPLSDSGGGQRFFSWYFLVNSFNKWCKIFPFLLNSVPPLPPLRSSGGGQKNFRALRARFVPPPELNPVSAPVYIYIYPYVCRMDVLYALLSLQI